MWISAKSNSPSTTVSASPHYWRRKVTASSQDNYWPRWMTDSSPGNHYDGWIGFISPTAEFTPKTVDTVEVRTKLVYQVRVFVRNPQDELRLGMPTVVTILLGQSNNPAEAAPAGGK
jgi:hypothetical protein